MKGLAILPLEKQHQLAMDGPKTNRKILRLTMELRDKEEHPPLQDIGSSVLHVVIGLFILGLWLAYGQSRNYYELCSSFCIILLPEEQSIYVGLRVVFIQRSSVPLGGWRMKLLLVEPLISGRILLNWSSYM